MSPSTHFLKKRWAGAPGVDLPRVATRFVGFLSQWAPAYTTTVVVPSGAPSASRAGTNGHVFFKKHVSPRSVQRSFKNLEGKA